MDKQRTVQVQEDPFGDYTAYKRPPVVENEAAANARLWTEANDAEQDARKYDITASRLPAQALQTGPALKILKRPSTAASSSSDAGVGGTAQDDRDRAAANEKKSLKERERAYEEARRRIYGESGTSAPSASASKGKHAHNHNNNSSSGSIASTGAQQQQQQQQQRSAKNSPRTASPNPDNTAAGKSGKPRVKHIPREPAKPDR